MDMQHTIGREVLIKGRGLHTGESVQVVIRPASAGTGIVFIRTDQTPPVRFPADLDHVCASEGRQTTLGNGPVQVRTVEHLMATFHGLGIDNATVEISGSELPGLDGSSNDFSDSFLQAGIVPQDQPREYIYVNEPIYLEEGNQSIIALPHREGLKLSYTLSYNHADLRDQFFSLTVTPEAFRKELAPSRTFCLKEEALALKAQGYGRGASLDNTLVFENDQPIQNTVRFPNEACRHKVMDLLGDLYLIGKPLRGHIIACRTGHHQNLKLLASLKQKMKTAKPVSAPNTSEPVVISNEMDINQIMKILPHRHPFLLVDRIISIDPGKKAVGIKNVTINEHFFQGHFPEHPIMPGVLILEALAQVGGVLMLSEAQNRGKLAYFMTIDGVKFRQGVYPGDQLRLEAEAIKLRSRTGQCAGRAYVNDKLVCEAEVKFAIVDPNRSAPAGNEA